MKTQFLTHRAFALVLLLLAGAINLPAQTAFSHDPASNSRTLLNGDPPLTQDTADGFAGFLCWVFDINLNELQKQQMQDDLAATWKKNGASEARSKIQAAEFYSKLNGLSRAQQLAARAKVQPILLAALRAQQSDPIAKMLLTAFETNHPDQGGMASAYSNNAPGNPTDAPGTAPAARNSDGNSQPPPGPLDGIYLSLGTGTDYALGGSLPTAKFRYLLFSPDGWVVKDVPMKGMIGFNFTAYRNSPQMSRQFVGRY
jgi:hypothetical protein